MSVYLIKKENSNQYKIGVSKNPEKRLKALETASSENLILLLEFHSEYAYKVEKALHRKYKQFNSNREWFNIENLNINEFVSACTLFDSNFKCLKENNNPHFI